MRLDLSALILDFDGVLTDDRVWMDQSGSEMVCCSRRDGLAIDVLRSMEVKVLILSTETNPVVEARARKLKVPVIQGSVDKAGALADLAERDSFSLANALYVGNDINDIKAMNACGYSACPADAHPAVAAIAKFVLNTCGGQGVVREVVEDILGIDILQQWNNVILSRNSQH